MNFSIQEFDFTKESSELCSFLEKNYVSNGPFRQYYSEEALKWILTCPGTYLFACVRDNGKIIATIIGQISSLYLNGTINKVLAINFLAVNSVYRKRGLGKSLIAYAAKRGRELGCDDGFYCGIRLSQEIYSTKSYIYPLNIENMASLGTIENNKLWTDLYSKTYSLENIRQIKLEDIQQVYNIYLSQCKKLQLYQILTLEEFSHWVVPRDGIVETLVRIENGIITHYLTVQILEIRSDNSSKTAKAGCVMYSSELGIFSDSFMFYFKNKLDYIVVNEGYERTFLSANKNFIMGDVDTNYSLFLNQNKIKLKNSEANFVFL